MCVDKTDCCTDKVRPRSRELFIDAHVASEDNQNARLDTLNVEKVHQLVIVVSLKFFVFFYVDDNGDKHPTVWVNRPQVALFVSPRGNQGGNVNIFPLQIFVSDLGDPMDPTFDTTQLDDSVV